jgi:hypothetical protein
MTAGSPRSPSHREQAIFGLLCATLLFAPLFRAGLAPLSGLTLQLLGVALLATVLWTPGRIALSWREGMALGLLWLLPLLFLVPLPASVLDGMPGHGPYRAAMALVATAGRDGALSLVAHRTQASWLVLLIPIAVFVATRSLGEQRQLQLVGLLMAMAAFQATLGLVQFGAAQGGLLLFGFDPSGSGAAGTYPNRNHLAGLLEMTLPLALALLLYFLGRDPGDRKAGWRRRVSFLASIRGHKALLYGILATLLVLGIIFTRSRSGIALAMLGILLTTLLFSRRIGGDNVFGPTGTLAVVIAGFAASIGLVPILDRFSFAGALEDARWTIFTASVEGLGTFLPFGSGPGTFPAVFPAFQPLELGPWFINRAHNDYIEWVFGGGIPAALLILLMLGLYLWQWSRIYSRDPWSRFRFVQVAAGIGLLLLLIHEFFDYNLHTPANMVVFALLAGIFFSAPGQVNHATSRRRQRRRTPDLTAEAPGGETTAPAINPGRALPEQIPNPFLDEPAQGSSSVAPRPEPQAPG